MTSRARSAAEELLLAERFDARGAHDEAINALARATGLGSIEAMTRLAKRLIVGDRAPLLPTDGVRFLADAAHHGDAEAAARLAVLYAAGAYVTRNLDGALKLLVAAAERGWAPAQQQLQLMAAIEDKAAQTATTAASAENWQRLADAVDMNYWVSPPAGRDLCEAPLIRVFGRFVPEPICRWLIRHSRGRLQRALVYDPVGGKELADHTRTNTTANFNLMDVELIQLAIQLRMAAACGFPLENMEPPTLLHYDIGEQITNHFDFVSPKIPDYKQEIAKNGQRILTFIVYLNDEYAGGETVFPRLDVRHKGQCGDGIFFMNALANGEPDLNTVHAGRPPLSGEKWIVTQFVRNRRVLGVTT